MAFCTGAGERQRSPCAALIESTAFTAATFKPERHEQVLKTYLSENFGQNYRIESSESGFLPMTASAFKFELEPNFYAIGVAGGHAHPSSGYAFQRIQRHTRQIADALVNHSLIAPQVANVICADHTAVCSSYLSYRSSFMAARLTFGRQICGRA